MEHKGTVTLETPRLILRRLTLADAEPMYRNWASDPGVTKFLTWPTHSSVEVTKQILALWGCGAYRADDLFLAVLDPDAAARVRDSVADAVADRALTLVVAEHRLDGWLPLVDRLVVLDNGRVVMDGPRNEVLRKLQGPPGPSGVSAAPREAAA